MNTRQALEASLVLTPCTPQTIAHIRTAVELDESLRRARRACTARNWPRVRVLLERAACLLLSLPEENMSQATVREADTENLIAELRRRAKEENDKEAAKIVSPKKKERVNGLGA